ncbi:hypothetical protein LK487_18150, partial [[Eubacterium] rectale]|nr:hypothetical protein [Agathobacter rectalis]
MDSPECLTLVADGHSTGRFGVCAIGTVVNGRIHTDHSTWPTAGPTSEARRRTMRGSAPRMSPLP